VRDRGLAADDLEPSFDRSTGLGPVFSPPRRYRGGPPSLIQKRSLPLEGDHLLLLPMRNVFYALDNASFMLFEPFTEAHRE
jgi:hypothetical protein